MLFGAAGRLSWWRPLRLTAADAAHSKNLTIWSVVVLAVPFVILTAERAQAQVCVVSCSNGAGGDCPGGAVALTRQRGVLLTSAGARHRVAAERLRSVRSMTWTFCHHQCVGTADAKVRKSAIPALIRPGSARTIATAPTSVRLTAHAQDRVPYAATTSAKARSSVTARTTLRAGAYAKQIAPA